MGFRTAHGCAGKITLSVLIQRVETCDPVPSKFENRTEFIPKSSDVDSGTIRSLQYQSVDAVQVLLQDFRPSQR